MISLYEALTFFNLNKDCSKNDVIKACRNAVKTFHPDTQNTGNITKIKYTISDMIDMRDIIIDFINNGRKELPPKANKQQLHYKIDKNIFEFVEVSQT